MRILCLVVSSRYYGTSATNSRRLDPYAILKFKKCEEWPTLKDIILRQREVQKEISVICVEEDKRHRILFIPLRGLFFLLSIDLIKTRFYLGMRL